MLKIKIEPIRKYLRLAAAAELDPLLRFTLQGEEPADNIRRDNLELLFSTARKHGVRYIYVGRGEIYGSEGIKQLGSPWPAMWKIARDVGFPPNCGNSDQYFCTDSHIAFPDYAYGAWDLLENVMLEKEVADKMKFRSVIEHFGKRT